MKNMRIFIELKQSIEARCSEVTQLIRVQTKAAVGQAEELMKKLEQEIAELRKRDAELEEISHQDDLINVHQVAALRYTHII